MRPSNWGKFNKEKLIQILQEKEVIVDRLKYINLKIQTK
jgi:hypothetical protein